MGNNKKAIGFIKWGIILNFLQYCITIIFFIALYSKFSDYTIVNSSVTNGSMQSFSFLQMLFAMIYSGELINYLLFFLFVILMIYILTTTIFLIIEIISYISLAKGEHISINRGVFFAIGIKNILFDISGIPFLIGSCAVKEENIK